MASRWLDVYGVVSIALPARRGALKLLYGVLIYYRGVFAIGILKACSSLLENIRHPRETTLRSNIVTSPSTPLLPPPTLPPHSLPHQTLLLLPLIDLPLLRLRHNDWLSLKDIITPGPISLPPLLPIIAMEVPVHLTRNVVSLLAKPLRLPLHAIVLSHPSRRALLLLDTILLCRCEVVLAVLHGTLIRPETRVCRWQLGSQRIRHSIERDNEGCEVERNS
jgi:hypothetical protein